MEKDIENLARGEVKSMKRVYTVLGGNHPFLLRGVIAAGVSVRRQGS